MTRTFNYTRSLLAAFLYLARQPFSSIEANLRREGKPGLEAPIVLLPSAPWLNNIGAVCTDHGMLGALHTNCTHVMRLERFCVF
jgi:hypothetical protein